MVAQSIPLSAQKPVADPKHRLARLWDDDRRHQQLARLSAMQMQACDEEGAQVWDLALIRRNRLPEEARVDLPSPRAFARVLGVLRSAGTLKKNPMQRLELSAEEIGELAGYSKATAEAVLRWLGSDPIKYLGKIVCDGLGIIKRGRRLGLAYLEGRLRRIYRTSCITLTFVGLTMLRMGELLGRTAQGDGRGRAAAKKRKPFSVEPPPTVEVKAETWDPCGAEWLAKINKMLV